MSSSLKIRTGGCQCGARRFRVEGDLGDASICHCRMCQKAFGNYFAPLVTVPDGGLTWAAKEPKIFQSSNHVERGFCDECGTPLTYEANGVVALAIATFDDPTLISPTIQWGIEAKIDYVDGLSSLPAYRTDGDEKFLSMLETLISYQHPDHEIEDSSPEAQS